MSLYVTGDVHGDLDEFDWRLARSGIDFVEDDVLLLLGDVGLKYGDYLHYYFPSYLAELPCTVLVMRGNHDVRYWRDMVRGDYGECPEAVEWQGNVFMREAAYPNVLYVADEGDVLTIDGHTCLAVPGAWSIDHEIRRERHLPFEPEEKLTEDERDVLLRKAAHEDVEYVFSHTCPAFWMSELSDLLLPPGFVSEVDNSVEEWLDDVLDVVSPTLRGWYFGHFHGIRDVARGTGHLLYRNFVRVF